MLEAMVDCAHGLGMAYGAAARAETDTRRSLELADVFQKSFLAVRMGIRLCMTLRAPPKAAPAAAESADTLQPERAEHEPAERPERPDSAERERERDYEPVSLPKFLSTLGVVARHAEALGDRLPAGPARDALPRLQALLAGAMPDPRVPEPAPPQAAAVAVLARPPQGASRRSLLGSAATPRPGPRAPPPWAGSG